MSNVLKVDRLGQNNDLSRRTSNSQDRLSYDFAPSPIKALPSVKQTAQAKAVSFLRWLTWAHTDDDEDAHHRRGRKKKTLVLIHPFSPFAQVWEFVSGVLLLYSAAVTPLLIAFYTEEQGHCGRVPTIYMDMFVDTFFLIEIVVHFVTGQVRRGHVSLELYQVASSYLVRSFLRDLCASAPIAWVEFFLISDAGCSGTDGQGTEMENASTLLFMRFVRMLKMLRLIKVLKIFNVMRDLCCMRPATIRLIKAGFMVFLMAHIGGCMWWFIKVQVDPDAAMLFLENHDTDKTVASIYITTVYFMIATLCTVGYGDISATGDAVQQHAERERVFSIFAMCLGTSVFAIIVSNMSALAAGMQSRENQVLEEMDTVVDYLRTQGVDKVFEKQVQNFYMFKCRQKISLEDDNNNNALRRLPDALQREIKVDINKKLMQAVWLFDGMTPEELVSIVDLFKRQQAIPDEVLVSDKETPKSLFIVIQGSVKLEMAHRNDKGELVVNENGAVVYQEMDRIGKGEVFAEVGVILQCPCPYRARAASFVEMYRLSVEKLHEIFRHVPSLETSLREGAEARMQEFAELQELDASHDPISRWYKFAKLILKKHRGFDQSDKAQNRLVQFSTRKGKRRCSVAALKSRTASGDSEVVSADEDGTIHTVEEESEEEARSCTEDSAVEAEAPKDVRMELVNRGREDDLGAHEIMGGVQVGAHKGEHHHHYFLQAPPKREFPFGSLASPTLSPPMPLLSKSGGQDASVGMGGLVGRVERLAALVGLYARWDTEQAAIAEHWAQLQAMHPTGDVEGQCRQCGCAQRLRETLGSATLLHTELCAIAAALGSSLLAHAAQIPVQEAGRAAASPMTGPSGPAEGGVRGPVDAEAGRKRAAEEELREVAVRLTTEDGTQGWRAQYGEPKSDIVEAEREREGNADASELRAGEGLSLEAGVRRGGEERDGEKLLTVQARRSNRKSEGADMGASLGLETVSSKQGLQSPDGGQGRAKARKERNGARDRQEATRDQDSSCFQEGDGGGREGQASHAEGAAFAQRQLERNQDSLWERERGGARKGKGPGRRRGAQGEDRGRQRREQGEEALSDGRGEVQARGSEARGRERQALPREVDGERNPESSWTDVRHGEGQESDRRGREDMLEWANGRMRERPQQGLGGGARHARYQEPRGQGRGLEESGGEVMDDESGAAPRRQVSAARDGTGANGGAEWRVAEEEGSDGALSEVSSAGTPTETPPPEAVDDDAEPEHGVVLKAGERLGVRSLTAIFDGR